MTDFEKYIYARWAYSVGSPIMSDAEYTLLDQAMRALHPNDPYCNRSWSSDPCPVDLLNALGRKDLIHAVVLSDKTESIPSLNSLFEVRSEYGNISTPHNISFKLDGWNIQASYYNGLLIHVQTRGRSSDALDTSCLKPLLPQSIPMMGRVLITLECTIPDADFAWFKDCYGVTSQRGAVSTALANRGSCLDHIALHAHSIRGEQKVENPLKCLRDWGFQVPMNAWVSSYTDLMEQVRAFSDYKASYGYPTDGLVVSGSHVRALRIYAWEEPIYRSYVTGYEETYGPHSIAIQLKIFPVNLPNSVQRRLPATNLSRIILLDLRPGAPVAFRIASSAIADIDEDATRLLQQAWEGKWDSYAYSIKMNEALKI